MLDLRILHRSGRGRHRADRATPQRFNGCVRYRASSALALILVCATVWTSPTVLTAAAFRRIALTVRVYETAGLPSEVERRALAEAETVLRAGLVDVRWQECTLHSRDCDVRLRTLDVL